MNSTQMANQLGQSQSGFPDRVGMGRARVQSARRVGPDGIPIHGGVSTGGPISHTEMGQMYSGIERRSMLNRPAKSAANKYRNMIPGNAIAEEEDYRMSNQNMMMSGFYPGGVGGRMMNEDFDSFHDATMNQPLGLQMHKSGRRSAVRLKHGREQSGVGNSSQLNKTTNHTVSHGAGVLLGNLKYGQDEQLMRDLNDSKTSENLKSVYDMRMTSHSNLAKGSGKAGHVAGDNKSKRKHLQSAVTRSNRPQTLAGLDSNAFSH